jgi:hypothetical protein
MSLARLALLRLRAHRSDPRNWRPNILAFVGDAGKRISMVRLANWFNQDRGLVTVCRLIVGDLLTCGEEIERERKELDQAISEEGLAAFSEVDVVPDFDSGVIGIVQANGIAGLRSNTVMVGWPTKPDRLVAWLRIMRAISRTGRSTLFVRLNWRTVPGREKHVDVWWGGLQNNGDMMLLLAYLLTLNPEWNDAKIVIRSIARSDEERRSQLEGLNALLSDVRIDAETRVIMKPEGKSIADVIHEQSSTADLVFLGLNDPEPGTVSDYARRMEQLTESLPTTVFVRNAGEFAGKLIDTIDRI